MATFEFSSGSVTLDGRKLILRFNVEGTQAVTGEIVSGAGSVDFESPNATDIAATLDDIFVFNNGPFIATYSLGTQVSAGDTARVTLTAAVFQDSASTPNTTEAVTNEAIQNDTLEQPADTPTTFVTAADAKEFMRVTGSDDDDLITRLLKAATRALERELNTSFALDSTIEVHSGLNHEAVVLSRTPVHRVDTVWIANGSDVISLDAAEYRIDKKSGTLCRIRARTVLDDNIYNRTPRPGTLDGFSYGIRTSPSFPRGHQNIAVEYTAGYTTQSSEEPALPDDLYQEIIEIAAEMYWVAGRDTSLQSETIDGYSYQIKAQEIVQRRRKAVRDAHRRIAL